MMYEMDFWKSIPREGNQDIVIPTLGSDKLQLDISCPSDMMLHIYVRNRGDTTNIDHYILDENLNEISEFSKSGIYVAYVRGYDELVIKTLNDVVSDGFISIMIPA